MADPLKAEQRARRAAGVLGELGVARYPFPCQACGSDRDCTHARFWTLGRRDATYRVDAEGLIRHAKVALRLAGRPPDNSLG